MSDPLYSLTEEQIAKFKETFMLLDKEGIGSIAESSLGTAIRALGISITDNEVANFMKEHGDKEGTINFPEFCNVMAIKMTTSQDNNNSDAEEYISLLSAFSTFADENGFLSATTLRHVMTNLGEEPLSDEEVDEQLRYVHVNENGLFSCEEYVLAVLGLSEPPITVASKSEANEPSISAISPKEPPVAESINTNTLTPLAPQKSDPEQIPDVKKDETFEWEKGNTAKWNRSKIMIVGAGRAGKTALTRSMTGEEFDENLSSTIGINEFSCEVKEIGTNSDENSKAEDSWQKYKESGSLLEGAIVRDIQEKKKAKTNKNSLHTLAGNNNAIAQLPSFFMRDFDKMSLKELKNFEKNLEKNLENMEKMFMAQLMEEMMFDERDYRKEITKTDINSREIMRCLAEDVKLFQSKYILSIYDYGGQSVFNSIHPFFLTKSGFYIIVFDMRELINGDRMDKHHCLENIRFWLNAISIHSFDEGRKEMAPIFLIGTRKDYVDDVSKHEEISVLLFETFQNHRSWPFLIPNKTGKGKKGTTTLCFYPINNKKGKKDEAIQQLMKIMEGEIDKSIFMKKDIPLVWLKVIDHMKSLKKSSLSFDEVSKIANDCEMSAKSIPFLLKFLHEMGFAMWHNDLSLRSVIILDPVQYFVIPATILICKHSQGTDKMNNDHTWHVLPIHEQCRRKYFEDWQRMIQSGLVSDDLLKALLQDFPHYDEIIILMKKYSLLMELESNKQQKNQQKYYLVPSLLPDSSLGQLTYGNSAVNHAKYEFYFGFSSFSSLEEEKLITKDRISSVGFLPNGLWERFLCLIVQQLGSDLTLQEFSARISKNEVFLTYQGQSFQILLQSSSSLMKINIFDENPVPIYFFLWENVMKIINECYGSLRCLMLLPYQKDGVSNNGNYQERDCFINFSFVEKFMKENKDLQITISDRISVKYIRLQYNVWLYQYKQSLPLTNYDIFLSYRWGYHDTVFTNSLFRVLCHFNLFQDEYSPISIFQDQQRLQDGEDFRKAFSAALLESRIIVPLITVESLKKMLTHNEKEIDNLLLEWILTLSLAEQESNQRKIIPIVFGSFELKEVTREVIAMKGISVPHQLDPEKMTITPNILSLLPNIIPQKTIQTAQELLKNKGLSLSSSLAQMTVAQIIDKLLLFQGIFFQEKTLQFPVILDTLTREYAERLVQSLQSIYNPNQILKKKRLQSENDFYFYNQLEKFQRPTSAPSSPLANYNNSNSISTKIIIPATPAGPAIESNPAPVSSSSIEEGITDKDYETAWSLLQPNKSSNPDALKALLEELGVDDAPLLKFIDKNDWLQLTSFLKKAPAAKLMSFIEKMK